MFKANVSALQAGKWFLLTVVAAVFLFLGVRAVYSDEVPTISIVSVNSDGTVTIRTNNFPANQTFQATMGAMGTRGVDGVSVGSTESGEGGSFEASYAVPDALQGHRQIAIRLQTAHANPYYAFNWFFNTVTATADASDAEEAVDESTDESADESAAEEEADSSNDDASTDEADSNSDDTQTDAGDDDSATESEEATDNDGDSEEEAVVETAVFTGTPSFTVCAVSRNATVTILTSTLPPNQDFTVTMGPDNVSAGSFNSGDGAAQRVELSIPAELHGSHTIGVQAKTAQAWPYYAFNWFYNYNASVC
ncbi:MAG: hypothetical protein AAF614_01915 [Chloroflexota bacterium]